MACSATICSSFHIQFHCNNFLETVERTLEARVDYERFAVVRGGHSTRVQTVPDQHRSRVVGWPARRRVAGRERAAMRQALGLGSERIIFGVDRLDYTKGIPDRIRASSGCSASSRMARARRVPAGRRAEPRSPSRDTSSQPGSRRGRRVGERTYGTDDWQPVVYLREAPAIRPTSRRSTVPPTSASCRRCTMA